LEMRLRAEPIQDDLTVVALMKGPMVMAADLAPAGEPWQGDTPVLVAATTADAVSSISATTANGNSIGTTTGSVSRPANLPLKPFFSQYDRRSAVYFPRFTEPQWQAELARLATVRKHQAELESASVDVLQLGDDSSERDHELKANTSETVLYRGRTGRWARSATPFEFRMRASSDLSTLHATYWGKQRGSRFKILVDGVTVGTESLDGKGPIMFIEREYTIPEQVTKGKQFVTVRFEGEKDAGAGPVFGCRILKGRTVTI
jgi:uncharacterized protein